VGSGGNDAVHERADEPAEQVVHGERHVGRWRWKRSPFPAYAKSNVLRVPSEKRYPFERSHSLSFCSVMFWPLTGSFNMMT
jgi:hypothetical protein